MSPPKRPLKRPAYRTPILGVQLMSRHDGMHVLVGLDGMESYSLGPFDHITMPEALAAVATDLRLGTHPFGSHFDDKT